MANDVCRCRHAPVGVTVKSLGRRWGEAYRPDRRARVACACTILAALLAGCAPIETSARRTEPRTRRPRPADAPVALLDEPVPARPHKVIGSVQARVYLAEGGRVAATRAEIIAALKKQARALGGDALLPIAVTPDAGGSVGAPPLGQVRLGSSEIWSALVIVWLQP